VEGPDGTVSIGWGGGGARTGYAVAYEEVNVSLSFVETHEYNPKRTTAVTTAMTTRVFIC
jgi:hypothetical protein